MEPERRIPPIQKANHVPTIQALVILVFYTRSSHQLQHQITYFAHVITNMRIGLGLGMLTGRNENSGSQRPADWVLILKVATRTHVTAIEIPIAQRRCSDMFSPARRMDKFTLAGVNANVGDTIAAIGGKENQIAFLKRFALDRLSRPELGSGVPG